MLHALYAWPLGILFTVAWGTLSLLGSLIDRSGRWAHFCMVTWSRWNLLLARTRVAVAGLEHIDRAGPQIFAVNHQSLADILVLATVLPVPFRFLAKRQLFRIPFLGWHMRRSGFIPIDRERPQQAARTLIEAAQRIRAGTSAVVFPEGTRSPDGTLLTFRGGAFLLAIRAGVPIVPVAIRGTAEIVRKGRLRVRSARVGVVVQPPVDTAAWGEDRAGLAAAVRARIEAGLAAAESLRAESGPAEPAAAEPAPLPAAGSAAEAGSGPAR